jgi:hypothetical protein
MTTPCVGLGAVMFYSTKGINAPTPNGVLKQMDHGSLAHLFNAVTLDDSSLALIALLAGMAAGYLLTNWRDQQLRTRKLKVTRKP